ncbi:hypothetical protein CU044_7405 [Streptomyces sp. L-9-10]|nr:hypothetical protein CU044_7405 [Streptomyces sp. L-9-10]
MFTMGGHLLSFHVPGYAMPTAADPGTPGRRGQWQPPRLMVLMGASTMVSSSSS